MIKFENVEFSFKVTSGKVLNHHFERNMRFTAIFFFVSIQAMAQRVDYNAIILPKSATDIEFREKLVQLAWQNSPNTEILNRQVTVSKYRVKEARRNWLQNIGITGNLNEFSIKTINGEPNPQSVFYPRYNIGATMNLGTIFNNPVKTKIEREGFQIALENVNEQKLAIRAEVLSRYEIYLSAEKIFKIRTQGMTDLLTQRNLAEQRFSSDQITYIEYRNIVEMYNQEQIFIAEAEKDYNVARIRVEELIGMKLTDAQLLSGVQK